MNTTIIQPQRQRYKGTFSTELDLNNAYPSAQAGDEADVDSSSSEDAVRYIWDANSNKWVKQLGNDDLFWDFVYENTASVSIDENYQSIYGNKHVIASPPFGQVFSFEIDSNANFDKDFQFLLTNMSAERLDFFDGTGNYPLTADSLKAAYVDGQDVGILSGQTVLVKFDLDEGRFYIMGSDWAQDNSSVLPSTLSSKILPVRLASEVDHPALYNASNSTLVGSSNGILSIDGQNVNQNDFVLLTAQNDAVQNGLYSVFITGNATQPFTLVRHPYFSDANYIRQNTLSVPFEGTNNASKTYRYATAMNYVNGVTLQVWEDVTRMVSTGSFPERDYSESDTETQTASTAFVDKINFTTMPLSAGRYEVSWSAELRGEDRFAQLSVLVDGQEMNFFDYSVRGNNPRAYIPASGFKDFVFNSVSSHQLLVRFNNGGQGTAFIRNARIRITKVS
jgi:hypothetical protein